PTLVGATTTANRTKGAPRRQSIEEKFRNASTETREVDERLVQWARQEGHRHTTSNAARKFVLGNESAGFLNIYPSNDTLDVNVRTLHERLPANKVDGIRQVLKNITGLSVASQYPVVPTAQVHPRLERFISEVLETYVAMMLGRE